MRDNPLFYLDLPFGEYRCFSLPLSLPAVIQSILMARALDMQATAAQYLTLLVASHTATPCCSHPALGPCASWAGLAVKPLGSELGHRDVAQWTLKPVSYGYG